jgi:hypothetical protein
MGGPLGSHTRDNAVESVHGEVRPARAGVHEAAIEHVEGFKPTPSLQRMQAGRTLALKSVEKGGNDAQGCRVMMWYEAWRGRG